MSRGGVNKVVVATLDEDSIYTVSWTGCVDPLVFVLGDEDKYVNPHVGTLEIGRGGGRGDAEEAERLIAACVNQIWG